MARNVRGDRVVTPDHVLDYDLMHFGAPLVIAFGAATFTALSALVTVIAVSAVPVMYIVGLFVTAGVATSGFTAASYLRERNRAQRAELSRDLGALRHLTAYDEALIDDAALWEAAGLADEYERLDDDIARLEAKPLMAALQREWLLSAREQKELLSRRILDIVERAADVPAL